MGSKVGTDQAPQVPHLPAVTPNAELTPPPLPA